MTGSIEAAVFIASLCVLGSLAVFYGSSCLMMRERRAFIEACVEEHPFKNCLDGARVMEGPEAWRPISK